LLLCVTTLAAATALAQQAGQSSPSSSSSKSQTDPSSQTGTSTQPGISSQPGSSSSTLSATGRGAGYAGQQQHFRSTKIVGAQVKSSSGEDVGRIEDVVLNPSSGRIDFAIISAESKLVPVPWQLLSVSAGGASAQGGTSSSSSATRGTSTDPSSTSPSSTPSATSPSSSGIYASAAAGGQPTFTLNADKSKLHAAPSFDRSRWPEMSASWSQRVYSHFGVQADTGVGGTGAGSLRGSQGSTTTDQGSTGTTSDKSSGKSSSDPEKSSDPSKSSSDPK